MRIVHPTESPLIAIVGPTGSGKSELALQIAEAVGGEIINCDSLQVYRGFDIGTAKLPVTEMRGIPHHMIDIVDPDELFTAGEYARRARPLLREITERNQVPIVVGGTGFYLRVLLEGLSEGPARNEALRNRLLDREQRRAGSLHRILTRLDTPAGLRIHPNDLKKTVRALELRLLRDEPTATLPSPDLLVGFRILKIGLNPPRAALYQRLDARLTNMFTHGLIDEVRSLLHSGVSMQAKPFESLGYKEALHLMDAKLTQAEALAAAQTATRQYAKRQWTWFRRDASIHWLDGFGSNSQVQEQALTLVFTELHCPLLGPSHFIIEHQ